MECNGNHKKVYNNNILTSYPPKQSWICSECGKTGIDVIGTVDNSPTYEQIVDKFKKNSK